MKKLFALVAMVLAAGTMQAQMAIGEFSVIPKAGLTLASLTSQDKSKINVGIVAGAEAEYQVMDFLGVSAIRLWTSWVLVQVLCTLSREWHTTLQAPTN